MGSDYLLMIPHLSKELNLIGFPELPYSLEKAGKAKSKNKYSEEKLKITFNSQLMLEALASTCFELVKQVKTAEEDDRNALDKLNFEYIKLHHKLKTSQSEVGKIMIELTAVKALNQKLQTKVEDLQKKIKDHEIQKLKLEKKRQFNEKAFKHTLKKKEMELFELHKTIWKQFNMADQNYFPENFELVLLNQPNFNKLWSTVKYSEARTKEEALKEAVIVLQESSRVLMRESFSLKTSFLLLLQEIHEILELMVEKLHLPKSLLFTYKIKELIEDIEDFNVAAYTKTLKKHLQFIRKICELFDQASFMVSDDLFVCWSKIIKKL